MASEKPNSPTDDDVAIHVATSQPSESKAPSPSNSPAKSPSTGSVFAPSTPSHDPLTAMVLYEEPNHIFAILYEEEGDPIIIEDPPQAEEEIPIQVVDC